MYLVYLVSQLDLPSVTKYAQPCKDISWQNEAKRSNVVLVVSLFLLSLLNISLQFRKGMVCNNDYWRCWMCLSYCCKAKAYQKSIYCVKWLLRTKCSSVVIMSYTPMSFHFLGRPTNLMPDLPLERPCLPSHKKQEHHLHFQTSN